VKAELGILLLWQRSLTDVGVELAGEPEMLKVHNIIER
jgi:hypothetical protein